MVPDSECNTPTLMVFEACAIVLKARPATPMATADRDWTALRRVSFMGERS